MLADPVAAAAGSPPTTDASDAHGGVGQCDVPLRSTLDYTGSGSGQIAGPTLTYSGPIAVDWLAPSVIQNSQGTWLDNNCSVNKGQAWPMDGSSITGEHMGVTLDCSFTGGTFSRPDHVNHTIVLENGSCTFTDQMTGQVETSPTRVVIQGYATNTECTSATTPPTSCHYIDSLTFYNVP